MDRSKRFAGLLEKLYFFKTSAFFSENIYKADESELRNFLSGAVEENGNTYNYLKTYLLLGSQRGRLDEANEKYLSGMFTSILESRFSNDNAPRNAAAAVTIKPYTKNIPPL
jgi:type VI protein secretion system component VasK